jgi:hypothetical protein
VRHWNWWSLYWLLWLLIGFCGPEFYALARGESENTLSDQIWRLEGPGASFARYMVGAFTLWLFLHFSFRWFR